MIRFFPVLIAAGVLLLFSCSGNSSPSVDYRAEMRSFVEEISSRARAASPGFAVIPQNGQELVTDTGASGGSPEAAYLAAIDGTGREDLFYGYEADDAATPQAEHDYFVGLCDVFKASAKAVLAIDYCSTQAKMDDSYSQNAALGYLSFAADRRELDDIPSYPASPYGVNADDVTALSGAKNFLYLINPAYATKADLLAAIDGTNYDAVIVDLFFDGEALTASDVASLKVKKNGGKRLAICYMSIGEAENYRYYWNPVWSFLKPFWLGAENPDWEGNYKVEYWDGRWKEIICRGPDSYLSRILAAGFDGVYLDIIDAFEYFEAGGS